MLIFERSWLPVQNGDHPVSLRVPSALRKTSKRRCAPEASGISAICPYLGGTMGESKARQRPGPWERARPRVHQHAPPRAGALPGTLGCLIGELSTPVRQTAFPATSLPARQRPGLGERARPRVHQHAPPRAELKKYGRRPVAFSTCRARGAPDGTRGRARSQGPFHSSSVSFPRQRHTKCHRNSFQVPMQSRRRSGAPHA